MKYTNILLAAVFISASSLCQQMTDPLLKSESVSTLFSLTPKEIKKKTEQSIQEIKKIIADVVAIPAKQRTFENTIVPIDRASNFSDAYILFQVCQVLKDMSCDTDVRDAAREALSEIRTILSIPTIGPGELTGSPEIYKAFNEYVQGNGKTEALEYDQRRYLQELKTRLARAGYQLPQKERVRLAQLKKEIEDLCNLFSKNIAEDKSFLLFSKKELSGLDDVFLDGLEKKEGKYVVKVSGHEYYKVMRWCAIEETRKRLWKKSFEKAYPENDLVLKKIIKKRDELAKLLGYKSFAHFDLANQMTKTPERVEAFFESLTKQAEKKLEKEFKRLTKELPDSVVLTKDGKLKPWDNRFLGRWYSSRWYDVDEEKVAEYFPLEHVLAKIFELCEKLFGIRLELVAQSKLWHEDVMLVEVSLQKNGIVVGYVGLDLYKREDKFANARCYNIVPPVVINGKPNPAMAVVLMNFSKPKDEKPMSLRRVQVECLFHEFGHMIHHLLGATRLASFAGMNVIFDFLEMPSQMLEQWAEEIDDLKTFSKHYKTGEPMPNELVEKIRVKDQGRSFGWRVCSRSAFSLIALEFYKEGEAKDLDMISDQINKKFMPVFDYSAPSYGHASSLHYTIYGPKCYCYLWSHVAASDVFEHIRANLKREPEIGKRYVNQVLRFGGSKDPNELLKNFLGREVSDKAFQKYFA